MIEVDDPRRDDVRRLLEQHRVFPTAAVASASSAEPARCSHRRSLYAATGFVPSGPFGEYTKTPDNVFMTRVVG